MPKTDPIQPGDFIRDRDLRHVCGIVVALGSIPFGRKKSIQGYRVRLAGDRETFIAGTDAEPFSKGDPDES